MLHLPFAVSYPIFFHGCEGVASGLQWGGLYLQQHQRPATASCEAITCLDARCRRHVGTPPSYQPQLCTPLVQSNHNEAVFPGVIVKAFGRRQVLDVSAWDGLYLSIETVMEIFLLLTRYWSTIFTGLCWRAILPFSKCKNQRHVQRQKLGLTSAERCDNT